MLVFGGAGGRNNEARIQVDGLNTGAAFNGAGVSSYVPDISNAQEIATTTSGGMGEAEVGGPSFSIVPEDRRQHIQGQRLRLERHQRDGRRQLHGRSEEARPDDAGCAPEGVGLQRRPRRPDRAGTAPGFSRRFRDEGSHRTVPGMFANTNIGDPTKWIYVADTSRPAVQAGSWRTGRAAPDRAADDAQQVQPVLGRAAALPGGGHARARLTDAGSPVRTK